MSVAASSTTPPGKFAIRVALTNHRSRREDFDLLARETIRTGRNWLRSAWGASGL